MENDGELDICKMELSTHGERILNEVGAGSERFELFQAYQLQGWNI